MSALQQVKWYLVQHLHLAKDALHIYVSLTIVLASCLVFGWRVRQWKPWLLVLFAAVAGEIWDIRDSLRSNDPIHLGENWKDIWNTMILPSVLLLTARYTPFFARAETPTGDQDDEVEASGDEAQVAGPAAGGERDLA